MGKMGTTVPEGHSWPTLRTPTGLRQPQSIYLICSWSHVTGLPPLTLAPAIFYPDPLMASHVAQTESQDFYGN